MFFKISSLLAINITVITLANSFFMDVAIAEGQKSTWNQAKCVEGLVKEGLKTNEATIWCNYQEECLVESQKEGLGFESAKTVCECTISQFRSKYSSEQFKALTDKVDSDKKVAREFRDVGETCFEKILFE